MANGRHAHESIPAVKSTIDGLECSPSHHSATSPIGHGGTRAVGHGVTEHTGKFAQQPGGRHGKKARKVKENFGKRGMMNQKSHGR